MIRTCNDSNVCTCYYRTPRCAGLCIPIPPSAYKIPNQSLEKYSGVLAPTSSMLFLARPTSYRTSHVPSIVELFTRSEMRQVQRHWQVDKISFWLGQKESNLYSRHQKPMSCRQTIPQFGRSSWIRTSDLPLPKRSRYQLRYTPIWWRQKESNL